MPEPQHPHQLVDEKGNTIECYQQNTIQRIFTLWQEHKTQTEQRDKKLKQAFDQNTHEIQQLRQDLDERKLINNYNKEEKEWLMKRVDIIGSRSEQEDQNIIQRITNLEKAVITIATNDANQDKSISKLEKLLYVAIGLILSFFITFGYETVFMGI